MILYIENVQICSGITYALQTDFETQSHLAPYKYKSGALVTQYSGWCLVAARKKNVEHKREFSIFRMWENVETPDEERLFLPRLILLLSAVCNTFIKTDAFLTNQNLIFFNFCELLISRYSLRRRSSTGSTTMPTTPTKYLSFFLILMINEIMIMIMGFEAKCRSG